MEENIKSFEYGLEFLRKQTQDLTESEMVLQPEPLNNHPAWVLGHLTASCQAAGREIGITPWLPTDWAARFGSGSKPVDDVAAYESKTELVNVLDDAQSRVAAEIRQLSPEQLGAPLSHDRYGDAFPTLRHAIVQMLVAHQAYHIGQVVIWRKLIGKDSVGESFL